MGLTSRAAGRETASTSLIAIALDVSGFRSSFWENATGKTTVVGNASDGARRMAKKRYPGSGQRKS